MCVGAAGIWGKDKEGHTIDDVFWLGVEFMGADFSLATYMIQFYFQWNDKGN